VSLKSDLPLPPCASAGETKSMAFALPTARQPLRAAGRGTQTPTTSTEPAGLLGTRPGSALASSSATFPYRVDKPREQPNC
jgi:hypothetical protein